jgi:BlaI family transcriptional regulator, penicillinase repressor
LRGGNGKIAPRLRTKTSTPASGSATICSATMVSATKLPKRLSELEHLVMDVLWARAESTAEDVREALAKRHPMKDSTSRTILKRLEEKGYVKRHVEGRTNVYRVSQPPRHLAVKTVQQIIDRLLGGSVEQLIVGMVDRDLLDEQELRRLAQKLVRRKNRTRRSQDAD